MGGLPYLQLTSPTVVPRAIVAPTTDTQHEHYPHGGTNRPVDGAVDATGRTCTDSVNDFWPSRWVLAWPGTTPL